MEGVHPIRAYRDRMRITQRVLANELEVSRETVARWEAGIREIDKDLLPRVVAKTGIPGPVLRPDLAELLHGEIAQ